jgi:DNA-binding LacI/PurR family transcriptional regulator
VRSRRRAQTARLRLSDVARAAGVSTATVSRVINNLSYVSPENRERVMRVVRRRNDYPNAHARSPASGRSNTIGLVISDISNPFFPELIEADLLRARRTVSRRVVAALRPASPTRHRSPGTGRRRA